MDAFLVVVGTAFSLAGAAFVIWPGPQRVLQWSERFDDKHEWSRRYRDRRRAQLKRWESRPSRYWFIPVAAAVLLAAVGVWAILALERRVISGPVWGAIVGVLLVYGLAKKPGSNLSHPSTSRKMTKGAIIGGGLAMLGGGIAALAAAF